MKSKEKEMPEWVEKEKQKLLLEISKNVDVCTDHSAFSAMQTFLEYGFDRCYKLMAESNKSLEEIAKNVVFEGKPQPIETAPKDTYLILIKGKFCKTGAYDSQLEEWDWNSELFKPTHWLPLPDTEGL